MSIEMICTKFGTKNQNNSTIIWGLTVFYNVD